MAVILLTLIKLQMKMMIFHKPVEPYINIYVTVWAKTYLVCTCQYFEKYYFKIQLKTTLALVVETFTERNNT